MARIIFHIDMDCFFVSCERAKNQALKNKPIVIASNLKRAIISAMSYEVKEKGFKTGDPFYKVKNKIKDLIIIEPHYQLYSLMSTKIFKYIENYFSKNIEIYSIDECYIDVTEEAKKYNSPINLAKEIQKNILEIFKIPCSIGISFTKFLAKMSTNKAKPFGIIQTNKEDIKKNFYDLPIKKIFGIGKASVPKLKENGINTYEDLVKCENNILLQKIFGKNYFLFKQDLIGENLNKQHVLPKETKSISNSKTFMINDSDNKIFLINELKEIVKNICQRAKNLNLESKKIALAIRHRNKIWTQKSKTLSKWTNNFDDLWKNILILFNKMWNEELIRGLGASLSSLRTMFNNYHSLNLFEKNNINKVSKIINQLNFHEGKNSLKTLLQYSKEIGLDEENIKFLRKNSKSTNKKINLEE
ncbi:Y-family DNA polymerase [Metamycoplasma canadense]|uniref:DNA polymerase IV (DinB) n=1 Tax=Metamycoplasma canadense TaxID=29554 RepID=A0A077L5T0_9BACT|nr:DNA polymerase IV [Metamycoplasma canadense]BAP39362.1 DNA polymerase IV (DinB) [Metamycoplasma canadense]